MIHLSRTRFYKQSDQPHDFSGTLISPFAGPTWLGYVSFACRLPHTVLVGYHKPVICIIPSHPTASSMSLQARSAPKRVHILKHFWAQLLG
jgi:hypothetical protein